MSQLKKIARYAGSRRGSMLIMVIVILVLLALIGTAMISTTRIDRVSSVQHSSNVQIDMLLESVKTMATDAIVNDLFGTNLVNPNGPKIYRPAQSTPTDYRHWDTAVSPGPMDPPTVWPDYDNYLGQRVPLNPSAGVYGWVKTTGPLINGIFESPYLDTSAAGYPTMTYPAGARAIGHLPLGGEMFPAFWMDKDSNGSLDSYVLAGDADGDGIADSGLFRIPVGELNGVAYYATVRIIDNNSAVNPTTAWFAECDFSITSGAPTALQNLGLFASNLGLVELLADYNPTGNYTTRSLEMTEYNKWRFDTTAASPQAGIAANTTDGGEPWSIPPLATVAARREDFRFTTQGEALQSQLARRLESPGRASNSRIFKALPQSDLGAFASRFVLKNPAASLSTLETATTGLPSSVYTHSGIKSSKYTADSYAGWFTDNFNFGDAGAPAPSPKPPLRALLAIRNGVSNGTPAQDMNLLPPNYIGSTSDRMPNYNRDTTVVPRTSINTAPFNMLWRGFWNVMADTPVTAPYPTGAAPTEMRMFRSVLRDPQATTTQVMTSTEVMMLRSALAGLNAIDLRDNDYHTSSRLIKLVDSMTPGNYKYEAMLYGNEPQPVITEVYANTDNTTVFGSAVNPKGYVAVEIYNPYPFSISLHNYNLAVINRQESTVTPTPTNPYPTIQMRGLTSFQGFVPMAATVTAPKVQTLQEPPVIPPHGTIILENYRKTLSSTNANDAMGRPREIAVDAAANTALDPKTYYVPDLHEVLPAATAANNAGGELVLLKPRRAVMDTATNTLKNDMLTQSANALNLFDEQANLYDLVPVDSFDFSGVEPAAGSQFTAVSYIRQNGAGQPWKMIYPGKYTSYPTPPAKIRQEGVRKVDFSPGTAENPWDPTLPGFVSGPVPPIGLGVNDTISTYTNAFPGIQLSNLGFGGPNKSLVPAPIAPPGAPTAPFNKYPFGGFMRNADILQVPYIGAYRIRSTNPAGALSTPAVPANLLEVNSITMDASLAHDNDDANNASESIGRFMPLRAFDPTIPAASDYYDWASDLFAHFGVSVPSDDYFPDVDPNPSDHQLYGLTYRLNYLPDTAVGTPTPAPDVPDNRYTLFDGTNRHPIIEAVANAGGVAADNRTNTVGEELLTTQGLININTAPWYVLQTIPWVTNTTGTMVDNFGVDNAGVITLAANGRSDNEDIARIVAAWRDGNGTLGFTQPHVFKSIFDLNLITMTSNPAQNFQNCFGVITGLTDPDDADGDFSPFNLATPAPVPTADGIRNDWEEKMLMINKVSNLITTRSDTFTVYVQVQGWTNIGTTTPTRVVQRRAAFIVDRTTVTPTNRKPTIIPVATP